MKILNKELVELKHKVLSQRIDRLYNIFIVLAQEEQYLSKLKVIREQYEKMYNAILDKAEYDKYEEVENSIIPPISRLEGQLDKKIYRTAPDCEQILNNYIFKIYQYDDCDLDEKLDRIEALKQILKLYMPYIKSEMKSKIEKMIIDLKFDILKRKEIKGMTQKDNAGIGSLLSYCDSKQEVERFKKLISIHFVIYSDNVLSVIENEDKLCDLLRKEIRNEILKIKQRIDKIYPIMKILQIVEKINGKIDITKEVEAIDWIQKEYGKLHDAVLYGQYSKYFEIKAMIQSLNGVIERLNKYIKNSPNGMDYILDTVTSSEYMREALLIENEWGFQLGLADLMKMYKSDIIPEEDTRYSKAKQMSSRRMQIRWYTQYYNNMELSIDEEEKNILRPLLDLPIFDKTVLGLELDKANGKMEYVKYFEDITDKKYSLNDWGALKRLREVLFGDIYINDVAKVDFMNYSQKLVWNLQTWLCERNSKENEYYLIDLDRETEFCTNITFFNSYWPAIEDEEYYNLPDFQVALYLKGTESRLNLSYVRTKKVIAEISGLKRLLDNNKSEKISRISSKEAIKFKNKVQRGEYNSNVSKIVNDIFDLWPETEENKDRRCKLKKEIEENVKKWSYDGYHPFDERVRCDELCEAIKAEVNRIRQTSSNYINCYNSEYDCKKIKHLISFMYVFLENGRNYDELRAWDEWRATTRFEANLNEQIECILYQNGGRNSKFTNMYSDQFWEYFIDVCKLVGETKGTVSACLWNKDFVNRIILEDMKIRPQRYLFVLQAPEENSIVPKETRQKIEEYAKTIYIETEAQEER